MDAATLEQVLYHIHNWFVRETIAVDRCEIAGGDLPADVASALLPGQWYLIAGSYLNDGLHQRGADELQDETFDGSVSLLAIPKALVQVAEEIAAWQEAYGRTADGPYTSESFGGYTYSLKSDAGGAGGLSGWQLAFRSRLNPWRKMR